MNKILPFGFLVILFVGFWLEDEIVGSNMSRFPAIIVNLIVAGVIIGGLIFFARWLDDRKKK